MRQIPSDPQKGEPYFELTDGVLPAIDKAIELGYSDPHKIGLFGHSFGGYAAYGLLSQTNLFKAAISAAGISDLLSWHGTFDPRFKYDSYAYQMGLERTYKIIETGQVGMRTTPFANFEKYKRNSPITYVSKIETPIMIIQGDMDYLPIQQGEQFFSALYRRGQQARFVRYWGEGHIIKSLANVEDMWDRIHNWFKKYLNEDQ